MAEKDLFRLLEGISHGIILPQDNLLFLLLGHVLHPDLLRHVPGKCPDEPRVPELRRNAQVFTASHEGVGFAAFGSGGDAVRVEVLLLAAGCRHKPVVFVRGRWKKKLAQCFFFESESKREVDTRRQRK